MYHIIINVKYKFLSLWWFFFFRMNWVRKYLVSFSEVIYDHMQSKIVFSSPDWPAHRTLHRQRFFTNIFLVFVFLCLRSRKKGKAHLGTQGVRVMKTPPPSFRIPLF